MLLCPWHLWANSWFGQASCAMIIPLMLFHWSEAYQIVAYCCLPVVYLAFFGLINLSLRTLRPSKRGELPIVGMAILILSFLPMSNLLFPVGTMIGERLLYIPSAGLLITILALVQEKGPQQPWRHFVFVAFGSDFRIPHCTTCP